mmetsp:Transcript_17667/g.61820  ORF Transcript_17667/g.61820 Transcript_17667/m.61820 type:complete len:255 (+) Transcript_17667:1137-1901(+)
MSPESSSSKMSNKVSTSSGFSPRTPNNNIALRNSSLPTVPRASTSQLLNLSMPRAQTSRSEAKVLSLTSMKRPSPLSIMVTRCGWPLVMAMPTPMRSMTFLVLIRRSLRTRHSAAAFSLLDITAPTPCRKNLANSRTFSKPESSASNRANVEAMLPCWSLAKWSPARDKLSTNSSMLILPSLSMSHASRYFWRAVESWAQNAFHCSSKALLRTTAEATASISASELSPSPSPSRSRSLPALPSSQPSPLSPSAS